jgi:hypothetical protein
VCGRREPLILREFIADEISARAREHVSAIIDSSGVEEI